MPALAKIRLSEPTFTSEEWMNNLNKISSTIAVNKWNKIKRDKYASLIVVIPGYPPSIPEAIKLEKQMSKNGTNNNNLFQL